MKKLCAVVIDILILLLALVSTIGLPVVAYQVGRFQIIQGCTVYGKFDYLGNDYDCAPYKEKPQSHIRIK